MLADAMSLKVLASLNTPEATTTAGGSNICFGAWAALTSPTIPGKKIVVAVIAPMKIVVGNNATINPHMKGQIMKGYVFNFQGRAFSPEGEVQMSQEEIETHNSRLAIMELTAMKETGKATLYLFGGQDGCKYVGTWASEPHQRSIVKRSRESVNNWGAKRLDVWFLANGQAWHGVNVGDNDIVRCKRIKALPRGTEL